MASSPLFVSLYLDEDVHPQLAADLRQRGFDCLSASEAGMLGKTDGEQLAFAAGQSKCVLSFNVGDFAILAKEWARRGQDHAGILVTQQVSRKAYGQLLSRVLNFLNTTSADEMRDVFRYL